MERRYQKIAFYVSFKAFELPEVAGLPIGGNVSKYFYRLEVHYNNPNNTAGTSDWIMDYAVRYLATKMQVNKTNLYLHRSS